jgi:CubicO group peptidase (beta-lactamase class C family)
MTADKLDQTQAAELHAAMTQYVARGEVPGIVTLVAQGDEVYVDTVGMKAVGAKDPMRRDTIFRIASLTKPITAAATLVLVDIGALLLDGSVEPWLPELADRRVLRHIGSALDDTVRVKRAITVRDLLTSTFGFGSMMAMPCTYPIQIPIREGHLRGDGHPSPLLTPGTDEWMRRLGALPLMHQPGERWLYKTSCDVLGVLIARVVGKSFEAFLRDCEFDPLGMKDTAFSVPASKLDRLAGIYQFNPDSEKLDLFDSVQSSEYSRLPAFESDAGGLELDLALRDFDYPVWSTFAVSKLVPDETAAKLNQTLNNIMHVPEVQAWVKTVGSFVLEPVTLKGAADFYQTETRKIRGLAKALNLLGQ